MTSQKTPSILVLGAGELGQAVLPPLVEKAKAEGISVSVLLRAQSHTSRAFVEGLGCTPVDGDIASMDIKALAEIFSRYDTVLNCVGFATGPGTQLKLARAVLRSGVRRYFPWQFGVDYDRLGRGSAQDLFDEQLDVRTLLRGQTAVKWVIVSTGMFLSFLFEPSFEVVDLDSGVVNALGSLQNEVTVTTPEDIGRFTAEILFAKPEIENEVVFVAGDTIAYGDIAGKLTQELGVPFETKVWDVPFLEAQLAEDEENVLKKYRAVFAKGPGMAWPKQATFNELHGLDCTDVSRWIREHRGELMAGIRVGA